MIQSIMILTLATSARAAGTESNPNRSGATRAAIRIGLSNEVHTNSWRRRAIIDPLRCHPVIIKRNTERSGYASLAPLSKVASIPVIHTASISKHDPCHPLPLGGERLRSGYHSPLLIESQGDHDAETSGPWPLCLFGAGEAARLQLAGGQAAGLLCRAQ